MLALQQCEVWLYGTPMGYYAAIEASNWKCRVTDISSSTDIRCVEWVLNLGVLVSGRMLNGCYSTFAFLWPIGWREDFEFYSLKSFSTFRPSLRAKGRLEWLWLS